MSIATVLKTRADHALEEATSRADDTIEKGAALVGKAEAKAAEVSDAALKEISALVESLNSKLAELGAETGTIREKARDTYADVEKFVVREVADRPLRTLAIVGLAGLALGMMSRK